MAVAAIGTSIGDVTAGLDAAVWSNGVVDGHITAGRDVSITAGDGSTVTVSAGGSAGVWVAGDLGGDVTAVVDVAVAAGEVAAGLRCRVCWLRLPCCDHGGMLRP